MSARSPPKRKPAEDNDSDFEIVSIKKVKRSSDCIAPDPVKQARDALYQLTVTLHPKFDKFPIPLRTLLQDAHKSTLYTHQAALQAGIPPHHRQTYEIITGRKQRSIALTFSAEPIKTHILDLDTANIALLEHMMTSVRLNWDKKKFSKTPTRDGLVNPAFLDLHSVDYGRVAWGVDAEGCVSFYYTMVKDVRFVQVVWYVRKGAVKIEEEV